MPLPFILWGAAALATAYSVKKGFDAHADNKTANNVNSEAREMYDEAGAKLEKARKRAEDSMKALGELKAYIVSSSLVPFVECFSKIKAVDFNDRRLLTSVKLPKISKDEMAKMQTSVLEMKELVGGGIAALGAGGLAGLAAYGGVGAFATASTGTAIATLSGAAATNATLAWLGGGSIATGGFGMAVGARILGGVVAAPALAVVSAILASKAEEAKHNAYANLHKAEIAIEELKGATELTYAIQRRFDEVSGILEKLDLRFKPLLQSLFDLVQAKTDYRKFSRKEQEELCLVMLVAKTLKDIIATPIIDKNGSLIYTPKSKDMAKKLLMVKVL